MGGVPDLLRLYPHLSDSVYKHTPGRDQHPIEDGQRFPVDGATIRAVHAPGHSHDHMCFVLEEENAMFTGDNVLGHGTAAVEHLDIWMDSLRAMRTHDCGTGYPAHGTVIQNLRLKIKLELETKTRREAQVLQGLEKAKASAGRGKGSVTPTELVTCMYGEGLDDEVRQLAILPFTEEVLRKLVEDARVGFEVREGKRKYYTMEQNRPTQASGL